MTRDQIIEIVRKLQGNTVDRGCTPGEAAKFAAKVAELMEKYQIAEAELRGAAPTPETVEVCQEHYWTEKQVHNPGVTDLISGLATGMCCKVIMLTRRADGVFKQAGYGIVGEVSDARSVIQIMGMILPQLTVMGRLEGAEHGYEKAGLIRWLNQYLAGAASEIRARLQADRNTRSAAQESTQRAAGSTALIVTGNTLAAVKQEATAREFKKLYPKTRNVNSRAGYDGTARDRGRAAGRNIGLHQGLGGGDSPRLN